MSDETSEAAWRGLADAYRQIAGFSGFDSTKQVFLIAPGNMTAFPGYNVPKGTIFSSVPPFTSTADTDSVAAAINQGVGDLGDTIPNTSSPFYAPTANSRYTSYGAFLSHVDPGAPANPAAYQKYLTDKPTYDTAWGAYLVEKSKANIAWAQLDAATQKLYNNNQATWETTAYVNQVPLLLAANNYQQVSAWFFPEQAIALGKDAMTLEGYREAWMAAQPPMPGVQRGSVQGATMLTASTGWQPQYAIDTQAWITTWNTWQGTTAAIANRPSDPWTPAVSRTLSMNTSGSNFWQQLGYDSTNASGEVRVPEPWLFFGEGSWSSTTQKQTMYQQNNAVVTNVTLNTCVKPATVSIKAGSWSIGDPGTQFSNADDTARKNLYPHVTAASLVFGVSFTVNFDHWTYQNVKSVITSKSTAKAVFSIFGLAFVRGSTSSTSTQSFESIQMNDTNMSITTQPDLSGAPTLLGVLAIKSSNTAGMLGHSLSNLSPNSVSYLRQKAIQAAEEDAAEDRDTPDDGKPAPPGESNGLEDGNSKGDENGQSNGHLMQPLPDNPNLSTMAIESSMKYLLFPDFISPGTLTSESKDLTFSGGVVIITFHLLDGTTDQNGNPRMILCPPSFVTACTVALLNHRDPQVFFNPVNQSATFFQGAGGTYRVRMTATTAASWRRQQLVALVSQA
ncbi:hypothetical protein INS49_007954 [Diaporthe citri]|uniref:uncharacterized protein n=1 Tax=Diaporthe citri TaxID=83186 RepID=UPI001C816A1D|nr:uncharacterized protein INS49_007954 [Diaporthe citri]KAG6362859.1 hypothetical protein INS49_007954 [Diaporthe citri]